jgi:hypothetical protein
LLLTFLVVVAGDEPQRDLPPRRKELYREYVERLFTVWEARRRWEGELSLGRLWGEEARRVALWGLYRTAWHLHRAYYGHDEEGPQAVRGEIESLLAGDLRERWEFGALQAETLSAELLRFWEGAGLLDVYRLVGQEWLAFRHLTFQEYGAARALAETYQDDADGLWQYLSPHLLRPQWAGVVPLTLAHLSGARATNLVGRLLAANEGDEDQQRPLFLAAAALVEGAEVADAPHRSVVDAFLSLARTRDWQERGQKASAEDAVSALGRLMGDIYAAAGLLALARDRAVDLWVREKVAEALGRLGRAEDLLVLARDRAVHYLVQMDAVEALGRLGRAEDLLVLARDRAVDGWARVSAAAALGELGWANEEVEILLALLRDQTVDGRARVSAAAALGKLERADEAAEILLHLVRDGAVDTFAWRGATTTLIHLGRVDDLLNECLTLAQDPVVEVWLRMAAALTLGDVGRATQEVLAGLRALTEEPGTLEMVRQAAMEALKHLEGLNR